MGISSLVDCSSSAIRLFCSQTRRIACAGAYGVCDLADEQIHDAAHSRGYAPVIGQREHDPAWRRRAKMPRAMSPIDDSDIEDVVSTAEECL